nr:Myxococcus xanthus-likeous family TIGR02268 [Vitiosangium cumulatum]
MFTLSSTALLGLALLAAPAEATERVPLPTCEAGTRYIELTADTPRKTPEVCIRPELSLTMFFDAKLASVEVEGRERFRRVKLVDDTLTLVASEALHDGERVPVTVYFEDGAAPTSATFVLVVHPSQAERQVEVSRHERTVASLRLGEQQARAEAQQCREENARLQAECSGQGGLTGLIANGWLGRKGVVARWLKDVTSRPGDSLVAQNVISYRAVGPKGRGRLAVELELFNPGAVVWTPTGAALVGSKRNELTGLTVAPVKPIPPGESQRIVVELDATELEAHDTFTLKLWGGQGGAEGVTLDGVTFP